MNRDERLDFLLRDARRDREFQGRYATLMAYFDVLRWTGRGLLISWAALMLTGHWLWSLAALALNFASYYGAKELLERLDRLLDLRLEHFPTDFLRDTIADPTLPHFAKVHAEMELARRAERGDPTACPNETETH